MKIQLIRNATMRITYAGKSILTDPMLAPKSEWLTVNLPMTTEEVVRGNHCVLVSHIHGDHFDAVAEQMLPKALPMFCQVCDEAHMRAAGFENVTPIDTTQVWEGMTLTRTGGCHGSGEALKKTGTVSGFVFQARGEPTVYWVGDSIWCREVEEAIDTFKPDIVVTHSGGAAPDIDGGPIIMDAEQTLAAARAAADAAIVAIHLESLSFCPVTRKSLREKADEAGIAPSRLLTPADGETLSF